MLYAEESEPVSSGTLALHKKKKITGKKLTKMGGGGGERHEYRETNVIVVYTALAGSPDQQERDLKVENFEFLHEILLCEIS